MDGRDIVKGFKGFCIDLSSAVLVVGGFCLLWNYVPAGIFGAPELTFLQSLGFLILIRIITGKVNSGRIAAILRGEQPK